MVFFLKLCLYLLAERGVRALYKLASSFSNIRKSWPSNQAASKKMFLAWFYNRLPFQLVYRSAHPWDKANDFWFGCQILSEILNSFLINFMSHLIHAKHCCKYYANINSYSTLLSVELQWHPQLERAAVLNCSTLTGNMLFIPHQLRTIPHSVFSGALSWLDVNGSSLFPPERQPLEMVSFIWIDPTT